MIDEIKEFRDGIFALNTRRFGTVAELMIEAVYRLSPAHNQFHDRYDNNSNSRVEIKFSRVLKNSEKKITISNVLDQCLKAAHPGSRALKSSETSQKFDSNIQQVKSNEFDTLYYGLFFIDRIAIFKMTADEVLHCEGYSNKQHKGNDGEGQFHLNNRTYNYHFKEHFEKWLTYEELYNIFKR